MALLDQVPYRDEGMGSRRIVDEKHVLMMQAALEPGQRVPEHKANSNVHLVVLQGAVIVNLAGTEVAVKAGDLLPIAFGTQMHIRNGSPLRSALGRRSPRQPSVDAFLPCCNNHPV